ncbi:MAG: PAS domain S-box protein [Candidatus Sumerlaeota bacterium]|nr:PAS domain S-box protein [Candidatus Sumerlaeota bacterium]
MVKNRTDGYRAQQALRESEERFRTLAANLPGAVYCCSGAPGHEMLLISDMIEQITGYPAPEFTSGKRSLSGIVHPDDLRMLTETMERSLAARQSRDFEYRIIAKDGSVRWINDRSHGIIDEQGGIRFIEGVIFDITKRKNDERERQRLAAIVTSSDDAIIGKTLDGIITSWNSGAERIYGYSAEEAIGRPIDMLIPADCPMTMGMILDRMRAGASAERLLTTRKRKDGRQIDVLLTVSPIKDEDGHITGLATIARDVTEQRQAERALMESEEKLRSITASALDAIIMMDQEGCVSFWNDAAERIFGYTRDDIIGRNLHDLLAPEQYHETHHKAFPLFKAQGQGNALGKSLELSGLRKNGEEFPLELSLAALKLRGQWNAVGIVRDITLRKQAEMEIKVANEAAEAANRDLQNALQMAHRLAVQAQAANIAKSEFMANISHEIRTPMNGICGMTGLLFDTELTEEQRECAQTIRQCTEDLTRVVDAILDFSSIETGKMRIETRELYLRELMNGIDRMFQGAANRKGLEYCSIVDADVPLVVRGDANRIKQVLLNLVDNAVKFTRHGRIDLKTSLQNMDINRATVRFSVCDTGIGIAPDRIDTIFQAFTQADGSLSRSFGGTGLGLAVSKGLVELMGGTIGIESRNGGGSLFWFSMPFDIPIP